MSFTPPSDPGSGDAGSTSGNGNGPTPPPPRRYPGTGYQGPAAPSPITYSYRSSPFTPHGRAALPARTLGFLVDAAVVWAPVGAAFVVARIGPRQTRTCELNADGSITVFGQEGARTGICEGPTALNLGMVALLLLASVAVWIVYVVREGQRGSFIGRRVVGQKLVARETGLPLGAGTNFVRNLLRATGFLLFGFPAVIDHAWALWDREGQTLHDKVTGAVVVPDR